MTRFALLFLALGSSAACVVGTVPPSDEPPPGVTCEKKATATDGHHYSGRLCSGEAGCHKSTGKDGNAQAFLVMSGTVFEKADGAKAIAGATVLIEWAGGSTKYVTGAPDRDGLGNFYEYAEIAGITFPATAKVSLCPDPEKVMQTPLNNAGDLDCTRSGCHTESLRIFLKN